MTCPKVGCYVTVRKRCLPTIQRLYSEIVADTLYRVVQIERGSGQNRGRVYLASKSEKDRVIPLWRSQVTPMPRCEYCDREGHTKSRATKSNCPFVRETV